MNDGWKYCPRCARPLEPRPVEGRQLMTCAGCGFVHYLDPKVAACTIPELDGGVVLLRRAIAPATGLWVFPGGYVNRGERVEEAAVRETWEESGLEVAITDLLGVYSYAQSPVVIVVYRVRINGGRLCPNHESSEVGTFARDGVPWADLAFPSTRQALLDFWGLSEPG